MTIFKRNGPEICSKTVEMIVLLLGREGFFLFFKHTWVLLWLSGGSEKTVTSYAAFVMKTESCFYSSLELLGR